MWAGIVAALSAFTEMVALSKAFFAWYKAYKEEQWTVAKNLAIQKVENAKTSEEILSAAQAIRDVVRGV